MTNAGLVDQIDALLPQTQCTRCGYPACRPYAQAIAAGDADLNRCPPGGDATIQKLARLTTMPAKPLAPELGDAPPQVALIDEAICIGCTKCIQACPLDAILGANKQMHTVIGKECSGCELCLPPCPVDCIQLVRVLADSWQPAQATRARQRFNRRGQRLAQERIDRKHTREAARKVPDAPSKMDQSAKQAVIAAAVARAKARRAQRANDAPK